MPKANVYNMEGGKVGEIELSETVFGIEPNKMHFMIPLRIIWRIAARARRAR